MHPEVREFVANRVKQLFPNGTAGMTVLEVGSRDLNGGVRDLFPGAGYVGIDYRPGPGVDEVADGASYGEPDFFDAIASTEAFEHCPNWPEVVRNCFRILKPGGWLIVTCASETRLPHSGVSATSQLEPGEYYGGVKANDLRDYLNLEGFWWVEVWPMRGGLDTYAVAMKPDC